jgi:acyl carrier protein
MTIDEIKAKLTEVLADEFEADLDSITPDAPLMETLDLDSLDVVDIVVLIEKHFGIILKQEDFVGVVSFQDFFDLINKKLNN